VPILSSLERRPESWDADPESARAALSVAHLDDEERSLVLGVLLEEVLAYTRSLPGCRQLRALVVFDEVYGLLPPHPANPPTKRPTVALMKQGRVFGVGVIVATQNPRDLDYRALSNAGFWAVGRLQTDAGRARVVESLAHAGEAGSSPPEIAAVLRKLGPRWALSYLRGPMTQNELRRALGNERRRVGVIQRSPGAGTSLHTTFQTGMSPQERHPPPRALEPPRLNAHARLRQLVWRATQDKPNGR
jgi:hypothetical protein